MIRSLMSGPVSGYLVSASAVVGSVVLVGLGHAVPDQLWQLAAVGLGVGAGATVPTRYVESPASPPPAAPAPAPAVIPAPAATAPGPVA